MKMRITPRMCACDLYAVWFVHDFAASLRDRRKQLGLTQLRLAILSGMDRSFISDVERCKKIPRLDSVAKLCKVLDMKIEWSNQ